MNVAYNVIKGLILEHGARFIVNGQETDIRLDSDLVEFRLLVLGGYYGVTPDTEIAFCPETAEFVWREGDDEDYEELRAKPYLLLDKDLTEALAELFHVSEEVSKELNSIENKNDIFRDNTTVGEDSDAGIGIEGGDIENSRHGQDMLSERS